MILVNMQNFKVMAFQLLEIVTSQKFPFHNGTSHRDSIFTSWIQAKLDKNHFLCLKTPFLAQSYTPSAFPLFSSKNKNFICSIFRDVSFQKQLQQAPW